MNLPLSKKEFAYKTIKENILTGKYPYLYRFPPEPEVAEKLEISRGTLREAFARLKKEELISSIQKNGTFVIYDKAPIHSGNKILQLFESQAGMESPHHYMISGIRSKANDLNLEIIDCETEFFFSNISQEDRKKLIIKNGISSVVFSPYITIMTKEVISILESLELPVILYGNNSNLSENFMSITTNYKEAWKNAVKHLSDLGHQKIVSILSADMSGRGLNNQEEHKKILRTYGMSDDNDLILGLNYDKKLIKDSVKKIFARKGALPTAALCASDFYAIQVYEAINELCLKIPEDISVMGFCGYPGSAFLSPPLSTIDIDYTSKGAAMIEAAANANNWFGKRKAMPITVKHKLIARESTGKHKEEASK